MKLPGIDYNKTSVDGSLGRHNVNRGAQETNIRVSALNQQLQAKGMAIKAKADSISAIGHTEADIDAKAKNESIRLRDLDYQKDMRDTLSFWSKVDTLESLAKTAYTGYSMYQDYQAAKTKKKDQESNTKLNDINNAYTIANAVAGKEVPASSLPASSGYKGPTTATDPVTGIETDVMVPYDDYKAEFEYENTISAIDAIAGSFENKEDGERWATVKKSEALANRAEKVTKRYATRMTEMSNAMVAHNDVLIGDGKTQEAYDDLQTVKNHIKPADYIKQMDKISDLQQKNVVEQVEMTQDPTKMRAYADHLQSPEDYKGDWNAERRNTEANALRAQADTIERRQKSYNKANVEVAEEDVKSLVKRYEEGKLPPPKVLTETLQAARNMPNFSKDKLEKLEFIAKELPAIQKFHMYDGATRQVKLAEFRDDYQKNPTKEKYEKWQFYDTIDDKITKSIEDNGLDHFYNNGALEYTSLNENDPNSVRQRKLDAKAATDISGVKIAPIGKADIDARVAKYNSLSGNEQVKYARNQGIVWGEDAELVYDALGLKEPSMRVNTILSEEAALKAAAGKDIAKDTNVFNPDTEWIAGKIKKHYGNVLDDDSTLLPALIDSASNSYRYYASKKIFVGKDKSSDVWKEVVKDYQVVSYDTDTKWGDGISDTTYKFIIPEEGVTNQEFNKWIHNPPIEFTNQLVPESTEDTPQSNQQKYIEDVKSGVIHYRQVGRKKFQPINTLTGQPILDTNGQKVYLIYGETSYGPKITNNDKE